MYLLDTNGVSEARRDSPEAVRWLRTVDSALVYVSVVTLGEIMRRIVMRQSKDPAGAAQLSIWLQSLRMDYRDRTLAISEAVAMEWGRILARRTRNVADFRDLPIAVTDPWVQA